MTELFEELFNVSEKLAVLASRGETPDIRDALDSIKNASEEIGKSWSGSWLGYHAHVYYADFQAPPPGDHFSQEWGLMNTVANLGSWGDWCEFSTDQVKGAVMELAGNPEMEPIKKFFSELVEAFSSYKSEFLSIIETELSEKTDTYLSRLKDEADSLSSMTASDVLTYLQPRGQVMTRDTVAVGQGNQTPPHIKAAADVFALNHALGITRKLRDLTQQAGSHLSRKSHRKRMDNIVGTNIFIGHGSSHAWRDLKDFINERLGLPWDEFNRVPIAGVTNIARLSEMLDSAAFSFLVMTGEDEQKDGKLHARMNVAHEAGLFQGRLGFMRAIILLEDGCEEFSNIEGLGQIRFPKGNIKAVFEEVRRVLEREEIISPD